MIEIYDRDGVPIGLEQFSELSNDPSYSGIALTTVMDASNPSIVFDVSTIWVGIAYPFGSAVPLIFETTIFGKGLSSDLVGSHYPTIADARQGHMEIVASIAATLTDAIIIDGYGEKES